MQICAVGSVTIALQLAFVMDCPKQQSALVHTELAETASTQTIVSSTPIEKALNELRARFPNRMVIGFEELFDQRPDKEPQVDLGPPELSFEQVLSHVRSIDPKYRVQLLQGRLVNVYPARHKADPVGVLDMPYYSPVMLARRLTTLDVLSNGRLCVGLGLGWNKDEMDATGADMTKRGALADEFLPLLKAIWTTNPVEFHGKFFNVPKSYINLKPVQKPHPPIYLGAFVPAALKRLALLADGWNPVFLPVPVMAEMFGSIRQMAKEAGRDPSALEMVVHAVLQITDKPLAKDRAIFFGSLDQISDDVRSCAKIGAREVFFDPAFAPGGSHSTTGCLCWNN